MTIRAKRLSANDAKRLDLALSFVQDQYDSLVERYRAATGRHAPLWLWWELELILDHYKLLIVRDPSLEPPLPSLLAVQRRLLETGAGPYSFMAFVRCGQRCHALHRVFFQLFYRYFDTHYGQRTWQEAAVEAVRLLTADLSEPHREYLLSILYAHFHKHHPNAADDVVEALGLKATAKTKGGEPRSVAHPEWALVIGGGNCVWDDVAAWEKIYGREWDGLVIAANDVGCHWPRELDHWVSCHPDKLPLWVALRAFYGRGDARNITLWAQGGIADRMAGTFRRGTSGLLAVHVAKALGCKRVVLCGVPLTSVPHFNTSLEHQTNKPWAHSLRGTHRRWRREYDTTLKDVRSMSGWTEELLGRPTLEWLLE